MKTANTDATRLNNHVNNEDWLRLVEHMLEVEPGTLKETDLLASIEQWDSLAVVQYLALIDRHFGVSLQYEQIASCSTLADLLNVTMA